VLLCSISAVNFRFGCRVLKSIRMECVSVLLESKILWLLLLLLLLLLLPVYKFISRRFPT
jgi:hypothetical protein